MKILIVSAREYAITTRGIDVMTKYLVDNNHYVDHMLFYTRINKSPKVILPNLRQLYFYDKYRLHRDKFKYFMPGFILDFYFKKLIQNQNVDFDKYDLVILESGYPVYLFIATSKPIIYRQSDPIEVAFNSNRTYYNKLELKIIDKSIAVSSACGKEFFPEKYLNKFVYWHSGYIVPSMDILNIVRNNEIVFFGMGPIDYLLVKKVALNYSNYTIKITGSHKDKLHLKNVFFVGYLEYQQYVKLISSACILILPYTNKFSKKLRKCSYTAKIFLATHCGIPIIVKKYGLVNKTDEEKKLFVYDSHAEALKILNKLIIKIKDGDLSFVPSTNTTEYLKKQSVETKIKELEVFFKDIFIMFNEK
jgi:hypothetical protein